MKSFSPTRTNIRLLVPLLIVLVLILYAAAVRDGHNWGGDFSQYILHAQNLLQDRDYTDLGYVQTTYNPVGPRAYPPGYSLSLVPLLYLFGLNFSALKLGVVLFFGIALSVYWYLARAHLPLSWSLGCLMFLAFTPWMLKFSNNVLSDIPYLAASLLAVHVACRFFERPATLKGATSVLLTFVFACTFRTAGSVLIGAFALYALAFKRSHLRYALPVAVLSFAGVSAISTAFNSGGTYLDYISLAPSDLVRNFLVNLTIYKRGLLRYLALYPSKNEQSLLFLFVNNSVLGVYLGLVIWGAVRNFRRKGIQYQDLYILSYLGLILFYQYTQGTRYLLPIIPLLSIYAFMGLRRAFVGVRKGFGFIRRFRRSFRLAPFAPTLIYMPLFLAYWFHYTLQPTTTSANILLDPDIAGLFNTVRTHRHELSGIIFGHPRVLNLFTGARTAICYNTLEVRWDLPRVVDFSSENQISHLITGPNDPTLWPVVSRNPNRFQSIYQNKSFTLYQIVGLPERSVAAIPGPDNSSPPPDPSP